MKKYVHRKPLGAQFSTPPAHPLLVSPPPLCILLFPTTSWQGECRSLACTLDVSAGEWPEARPIAGESGLRGRALDRRSRTHLLLNHDDDGGGGDDDDDGGGDGGCDDDGGVGKDTTQHHCHHRAIIRSTLGLSLVRFCLSRTAHGATMPAVCGVLKHNVKKKFEHMTNAELKALITKREKAKQPKIAGMHALSSGTIRIGSICTGWASEAQAFTELNIPVDHVFGCDILKASKMFCNGNFKIQTWFDDVFQKDFQNKAQPVDILSAGFPCQPFSSEGERRGKADKRATVIEPILKYVKRNKPKGVLLENVPGFMHKRHKKLRDIVIKFLMKAGPYKVQIKVLNSLEFGVPQSRKRVYIVGIREDCAVQDFTWPVPFGTPPITKFLDKGVTPKHMSDAKLKNVKACFTAIKKKTGMDPTQHHFIIDVGTGRGPSFRYQQCPTITRTRGAGKEFLDTRTMKLLSTNTFIRLQGSDPTRFDFGMLSERQAGALAGNAMTITVVKAVLSKMLNALGMR